MTNRKKPADIVFVLDATSSTQSTFTGVIRYIQDYSISLTMTNRNADFRYAAIIYRDPVDYVDVPSEELSPEGKQFVAQIEAQMEEARIKKLKEKGLYDEELEEQRKKHLESIDLDKYPINKNVAIPFCNNMEILATELDKVKCDGGNDNQEDWVGALQLALDGLEWREGSKKLMIWVADANAHGRRFNGGNFDNHNEEEGKLEPLVRRMAKERIYFNGFNIMKGDDGCKLTLEAIKDWYESAGGPGFLVQEFHPIKDPDLDDDDWPPEEIGKFTDTLKTTMAGFKFD